MDTEKQHIETSELTPEKEPSSISLVLALGIAGLLSGIILVGTYIYTAPIIKANKEAAMQRAIFKVLPDCASYSTLKLVDGQIEEIAADAKNKMLNDRIQSLIHPRLGPVTAPWQFRNCGMGGRHTEPSGGIYKTSAQESPCV